MFVGSNIVNYYWETVFLLPSYLSSHSSSKTITTNKIYRIFSSAVYKQILRFSASSNAKFFIVSKVTLIVS